MTESSPESDAMHYLSRTAASRANWSCTIGIANLLVLAMGFANVTALVVAVFLGWRARCHGMETLRLNKRFDVGGSYLVTARIGLCLGILTAAVALLLIGGALGLYSGA